MTLKNPALHSCPPKSKSVFLKKIPSNVSLAILLLGLLFATIFYRLDESQRTIGLAVSYTAIRIAPPLVLSMLEHLARPAGPRKSAKKWLMHVQIMLANYAAATPNGILAAYLASAIAKYFDLKLGLIDLRIALDGRIVLLVLALPLSLLVGDFFFYWYHRALHRSKILWQHHKMHHLDPEFDALTGPREYWLEGFLSVFFIAVPVLLLFRFDNVDPFKQGVLSGSVIGLLRAITFINHSNLRIQFGRASVLFISSQTHRIHHSYLPQHRDKNFAAAFPIWDILFGTYYHPAHDEFPPTGVTGEKELQSMWEAQIFGPREWWRMFRARHGLPSVSSTEEKP